MKTPNNIFHATFGKASIKNTYKINIMIFSKSNVERVVKMSM